MTLSDRLRELDEALSSEDQTDALGAAFDLRAALPAIREVVEAARVFDIEQHADMRGADTPWKRLHAALTALDAELSKQDRDDPLTERLAKSAAQREEQRKVVRDVQRRLSKEPAGQDAREEKAR